jgi:hypothetical protein
MKVQAIRIGDEGQLATRDLLARFHALAGRERERHANLSQRFEMLEAIDRQHGGSGALAFEDAGELVRSVLADLAALGAEGADLVIGVALWAIRHEVAMLAVEPVANALAARSNAAGSPQELTAVFGLMQGVIANVAARLAPDLERSNPERAWRILHLNLAITAIRTQDERLMDFAFDAFDAALPDERAGFYSEALALALAPGIAPQVKDRIERRHLKWTAAR